MKFNFIKDESVRFPALKLCEVMQVSSSAYYAWRKRPGTLISAETLHLHHRMKALFRPSRNSLGSREMMKKLREEGFRIGRYVVERFFGSLKHCTGQLKPDTFFRDFS